MQLPQRQDIFDLFSFIHSGRSIDGDADVVMPIQHVLGRDGQLVLSDFAVRRKADARGG